MCRITRMAAIAAIALGIGLTACNDASIISPTDLQVAEGTPVGIRSDGQYAQPMAQELDRLSEYYRQLQADRWKPGFAFAAGDTEGNSYTIDQALELFEHQLASVRRGAYFPTPLARNHGSTPSAVNASESPPGFYATGLVSVGKWGVGGWGTAQTWVNLAPVYVASIAARIDLNATGIPGWNCYASGSSQNLGTQTTMISTSAAAPMPGGCTCNFVVGMGQHFAQDMFGNYGFSTSTASV